LIAAVNEDSYILPGKEHEFVIIYNVSPDKEGNFLWEREILHEHEPNKTNILVNPLESMGYTKKAVGFEFQKGATDNGFYTSGKLSPNRGTKYSLLLKLDPEKVKSAQKENDPGPLEIIREQLKRLVFENIILVFLINDAVVLGLSFYLFKRS